MSPEQARGKPVDRRTDVWAFGCVLYEMLTGRVAFDGETVSDTIARILEREPDWTLLPADTPESIRRLLRRCLAKDPKQRLRDVADVRIEIDSANEPLGGDSARAMPPVRQNVRPAWLPWTATAALAIGMAGLLAWNLRPPPPPRSWNPRFRFRRGRRSMGRGARTSSRSHQMPRTSSSQGRRPDSIVGACRNSTSM